jgi:hypothetical protein
MLFYGFFCIISFPLLHIFVCLFVMFVRHVDYCAGRNADCWGESFIKETHGKTEPEIKKKPKKDGRFGFFKYALKDVCNK